MAAFSGPGVRSRSLKKREVGEVGAKKGWRPSTPRKNEAVRRRNQSRQHRTKQQGHVTEHLPERLARHAGKGAP